MLDKLTYRILSGNTRLKIDDEIFLVHSPTVGQKYIAEELYEELYEIYLQENLKTDESLLSWMIQEDFWSFEEEKKIGVMKKNIEEFQVKLFECGFRGYEKEITKKAIQKSRDEIRLLTEKKHHYDYLSAKGQALIEKNKFLIAMGICDVRGNSLFNEYVYHHSVFPLFDKVIIAYNNNSISIPEYRLIARNEPWRQYWSAKDVCRSIFNNCGIDLTEEQLTLISWTKLYDSIYQHPKCPVDEIIDDDDILDGFLIKDRRDREAQRDKDMVEGMLTNEKIRNAEELYLVPKPEIDLSPEKIYNLNTDANKQVLKQRDAVIDKMGKVAQYHLPDVKMKLQMQMNAESMRK